MNWTEMFHKHEELLKIQLPPNIKPLLILTCEQAMRIGYNLAVKDFNKGKKLELKKSVEDIIEDKG